MSIQLPTADNPVVLLKGDALELLPQIPAGAVDAVVTDPPYGIGFKYNTHDDSGDEYEALMGRVVPLTERCVIDGGGLFWWQGMPRCSDWHRWFPTGYRLLASCKNFVQMRPVAVQYAFDPVVFWWKGKPRVYPENGRRDWHIANTARWVCDKATKGIHPCQRPIDAVEYVVRMASNPGDIVLDPFAGSGTTALACLMTGRRCLSIELDPHYHAVAQKRIDDYLAAGPLFDATPQQAELFTA
jgi:site-specific DNA-methyltransferase (adenine-specific)